MSDQKSYHSPFEKGEQDEDYLCKDVRFTWKCASCHKVSIGFVFPYGRCELCGGELKMVTDDERYDPREIVHAIQGALQFEINNYLFYQILIEKTTDPMLIDVFESLRDEEEEHYKTIEKKYGIEMEPDWKKPSAKVIAFLSESLKFSDKLEDIIFNCNLAIEMEKKTYTFFKEKADSTENEGIKSLYYELAAEEQAHIAKLETERDNIKLIP